MERDIFLAIDVGTGSVRVALIGRDGKLHAVIQKEHNQITPHHGWSEQSATQWWKGTRDGITHLLKDHPEYRDRLLCICTCGQMHGTVLVDADNKPTLDLVPLWNDKRNEAEVSAFCSAHDVKSLLPRTANPPTAAWPAFKLHWIRKQLPEVWDKTDCMLMPKDFINLCLTGVRATDYSEASCFYMMNAESLDYDPTLLALLDIPRSLLPPIFAASEVIGTVLKEVCLETSLPEGLPVVAGTSDMAASILGSGVWEPGTASDSTGTSTLLTVITKASSPGMRINNLHMANNAWGAFTILDAGGDAMRWGRLAFHDNSLSYQEIAELSESAEPCCGGLIFLPYLTGERNALHKNTRAQFFGLTRNHRIGDMHRAILEGAAFGARRCLEELTSNCGPITKLVASGGGARSKFVLRMKASIYGLPIVCSEEPENGLVGCAMIAGIGMGLYEDAEAATHACVHHGDTIAPDPQWQHRYQKAYEIFCDLYDSALPFYDRIDGL